MIDRNIAPAINKIEKLELPEVEKHELSNGAKLYEIHTELQDIVKLEITFAAGRPFENHPMVAKAAAQLLKDGSKQYPGSFIAETFDFYGSTLEFPFHMDLASIETFIIAKHFHSVLPIIVDVILHPSYRLEDLKVYQERYKNNLRIDLSKSDILAYRLITEQIFGPNHPYGYNSSELLIDKIQHEDIIAHHLRCFTGHNCNIFVAGKTTPSMISQIKEYFELLPAGVRQTTNIPKAPEPTAQTLYIKKDNAVQTSIRVGRVMYNQKHPDFLGMSLLNTLLGGYFGSRLMSNIREDKGYTYNVFSMLDNFNFSGYFYIGADVSNEFVEPTLKEIAFELMQLKEAPIGIEELNMVKNYLIGSYLAAVDGPLNAAYVVKSLLLEDLPLGWFKNITTKIENITAEELQRLAKEYLELEQMSQVIVGN